MNSIMFFGSFTHWKSSPCIPAVLWVPFCSVRFGFPLVCSPSRLALFRRPPASFSVSTDVFLCLSYFPPTDCVFLPPRDCVSCRRDVVELLRVWPLKTKLSECFQDGVALVPLCLFSWDHWSARCRIRWTEYGQIDVLTYINMITYTPWKTEQGSTLHKPMGWLKHSSYSCSISKVRFMDCVRSLKENISHAFLKLSNKTFFRLNPPHLWPGDIYRPSNTMGAPIRAPKRQYIPLQ